MPRQGCRHMTSVRGVDVVVIGGGAAGLTAATEARRRGATTVLVTDGPVGGECTFTGCVPSKTLLAAAARGESFTGAMATVRATVERVAASDAAAMDRAGVEVIRGRARLVSPDEVEVSDWRLRARHVVVATGARPLVPDIEGLAGIDPLTNQTLFDLTVLPPRLAVLGGGAIGCEMAQAFARLGSAVTVVEAAPRLLPGEEPEASALVADALTREGVRVRLGEQVARVERQAAGGDVSLHFASGPVVEAERVLVAVGRAPVTEGPGLTEVGVAVDEKGFVRTRDTMATSVRGVWAIGDVTGRMPFTHAAVRMALVAVHNALGGASTRLRPSRFDPAAIPWVIFTSPEVARVGMTEAQAAHHGGRVAFLPLDAVDRAITAGAESGFVKLIAGPRRLVGNRGGGRVLGATVVAPTGGELIHEPTLAMHTGMFTGRLAQATHAYPTWSMAVQQAAAQFFVEMDGRTARPSQPGSPEA